MLQSVRTKLRKIPLLHNSYMRVKRMFSSDLVGMTTGTEQAWIERYGERKYQGYGEVVDLGCWLGSTTIPLVKGLMRNPRFVESDRRVFAFDLFRWFDWMNESVAGTALWGRYREGDDFVAEFEKRVADHADRIVVRKGDLREIGWGGGEIEFLLVDAMKGWDLANAIVRDFYPSLVPSKSLVFHQDFAHYFTPWIHLIQWRLKDCFEFVDEVRDSQSVVFACIERVPDALAGSELSFESFTDEEVDKAFEYSLSLVSPAMQPNVAAAKVMWFVHQKRFEDGRRVLAEIRSSGVPMRGDLVIVSDILATNEI